MPTVSCATKSQPRESDCSWQMFSSSVMATVFGPTMVLVFAPPKKCFEQVLLKALRSSFASS